MHAALPAPNPWPAMPGTEWVVASLQHHCLLHACIACTDSELPCLLPQSAMTVPNWNRCAQTMFDIMVGMQSSS